MKARSLRCVGAARVLLSQCCGLEWLLMQMRWAVDCVLCSASPSSRGFAA